MKVLKIAGTVSLKSIGSDTRSIICALGGVLVEKDMSTIGLRDGGVMIVDGNGLAHGKPYNQLAALVAGTTVYGVALIVGADDNDEYDDVPTCYLALMQCGE